MREFLSLPALVPSVVLMEAEWDRAETEMCSEGIPPWKLPILEGAPGTLAVETLGEVAERAWDAQVKL